MKHPRHKKLIIYIFIAFFMSFLILGWNIYNLAISPLISKNNVPIIINVDASTSASKFAQLLKDQHLIDSPNFFKLMIRFSGMAQHLKAGVYQINPGETAMQLLHRVATGDVLTQKFVIIEGTTQQKISDDLMKANYLKYSPEDWLAIQDKYSSAEGLLLADTYQYNGGSSSKTLLEHAHRNLVNYLDSAWANRAPDLPYQTPYELLIAASIIEKETAVPQERKLISGVMVNRLKKKMPLQMDPTVIYALGSEYKGKLSHNDMQVNSPYNSYLNRGLPPTPIAMVGKEAIDAAAHPQLSNYLYFVAKGDGTHQFSETYSQQRQAIDQYMHRNF
ncbi:endolytic transglycosylase MltG [Legionella fallonii]|uniref:Endolytic murein transglycosylase n=1 Tax=Legionella fallonii LLAP-10 TaxID=1212491 RepID=A0A098G2S2_9GAMM|nr:endolytic transglycosylase MltG [Legionella fallonii]CEG56753.1 Periplasmic solute-binding protein [Legionella fallonii LLAP-10]